MRIVKDVEIMEVTGIERLSYDCSDGTFFLSLDVATLTGAELAGIRDAITAILQEAEPVTPAPRTWKAGEEIPDDVLRIEDAGEDVWYRESAGGLWDLAQNTHRQFDTRSPGILENCGPVTEVLEP